ncbi:protein kinase kin1 [Trichogramma pretiosum]|uniref:protein kinase kin1 n=1 Tax=Trichogramma pretiosum TaxID=7493 RepID=UPI000C71C165|nr:protein kinase kin1 [Trichogramma pretiosum]
MVISEANVHNIMGGMESAGGVRLHNHKRKLKQRFSIIKKLGQGTYGKVQLGINKETGQEVAIKTIKKCKIETEADLVRIRREIQIMSSVHHPNIIHIYEVFENREKMVLVMEYAAGGELYDYLSEHKVLTEVEARRIFRQISTAIFYCHKHKICHRDLKLENILLDQNGNAKIADFGLSNVFNEQGLLSTFCGSPLYASPEIVNGTPYLGPEVDCWSLGVLLYTLVYGAMPFDGTNFKHLVKQITYSDYFEPKQPSRASPLIKDMLTVSPTQRADIERICSHWWVNEGYEQSCLYIAENLAAQTPVRLDLLLSLVPEQQLVKPQEQVEALPAAANETSSLNNNNNNNKLADAAAVVPPASRCYSQERLMQVDKMGGWTLPKASHREKKVEAPVVGEGLPKIDDSTKEEQGKIAPKVDNDARRPRPYKKATKHHSAPIYGSSDEKLYASVPVKIFREKVITDAKNEMPSADDTRQAIKLDDSSDKSLRKLQSNDTIATKPEAMSLNADAKEPVKSASIAPSPSRKQFLHLTDPNKLVTKPQPTVKTEEESPRIVKLVDKAQAADDKQQNKEKKSLSPEKLSKAPKKLRIKALSLDSEMATKIEPIVAHKPPTTTERRRSKIFETAEKFNQLLLSSSTTSSAESDQKPAKKLFIPGVNVEGAKAAFERKASLSSTQIPQTLKPAVTKIIIDVPQQQQCELNKIDSSRSEDHVYDREEEKRRAVNIITGALGKPPMQRKYSAGSLLASSDSNNKITKPEEFKIPIEIAAETTSSSRATTMNRSLSTTDKKFQLENSKAELGSSSASGGASEPSNSKSATLPRLRKTSKAKITLTSVPSPDHLSSSNVRSSFDIGSKLGQQHQPPSHRSEMFFPINSHSRSGFVSATGPEPIRKSPREFIIPISMEDRTYANDSRNDDSSAKSEPPPTMPKNPGHNRILRSHQVNTLLSDASGKDDDDDEPSLFPGFSKKNDEFLQNHLHRLRSSRPRYATLEHEDSLSSGEDDDDDGFEFLTAENLFSTLLSRVRNLTQRLNINDNASDSIFPSGRLLSRIGSNSSQDFWNRYESSKNSFKDLSKLV